MAKQTVTRVIDDIDHHGEAQPVEFTWNGVQYGIDLSEKNRAALDSALAPYVAAARRLSKAPAKRAAQPKARSGNAKSGIDLAAVRVWAKSAGHNISDRGRIPAWITDLYHAGLSAQSPADEPGQTKAVPKVSARKAPANKVAAKKVAAKKVAPAKNVAAKNVAVNDESA